MKTPTRKYKPSVIKDLREKNNLSVREFAAKIGSHRNMVIEWEHEHVRPSLATMEKIMAAFNVDESIFFSG